MRLIDADALIDSIKQYANEPVKLNDRRWNTRCTAIIEDMIGTVKLQPTAEAIPIVKCKDCKHFLESWGSYFCRKSMNYTDMDDFCSGGERRKKNDEA